MPVTPTYPGVYIEEIPSGVRTITGVATSIAAFVGATQRGPTDRPVHLTSMSDYEEWFGAVDTAWPVSVSVAQFYLNGGAEAEVVRLSKGAPSKVDLDADGGKVPLVAAGPGAWGDGLRVRVDHDTAETVPAGGGEGGEGGESGEGGGSAAPARTTYNLTVLDTGTGRRESFLNVSADPRHPRSLKNVLAGSRLLALPAADAVLDKVPRAHKAVTPEEPDQDLFSDEKPDRYTKGGSGTEGGPPDATDYRGSVAQKTGIHRLHRTDIFNLLCLPGAPDGVLAPAAALCVERRAILLVDPPSGWTSISAAAEAMATPPVAGDAARNAAVYFPPLEVPDPAAPGVTTTVAPSGTMAGVLARTDVQRGVWKAAAGTGAGLAGVTGLAVPMTDLENGRLNKLGVNCLRTLPVVGPVSWGARTLRGADRLADEWKYLPIRRLALFIEESLFRGTQWVVFEPNDEPLWSSIRTNVGAFMNGLFRQGAFAGLTAREAYLVKCDKENNPQNTVDQGIVNIRVGFAPLKPAEFVIIQIQQLAGQLET